VSPQTWQRVKSLYHAASELPPAEGEAYIRNRADGDAKVEFEALRLLRAGVEADDRITRLQVPKGILKTNSGALQPGQVLDNRYEIRRFIAQGGFGEVYEAEDLERGEAIAIKLLKKEFSSSQHLPWLRREVLMARRIQHPNVCRVFDVVQSPQAVFLTMELLPGDTLAQLLKRDGAMNERRALPLIRQIVAALAAAHASGVVHRDLKPSNILIVPRPHGADRAVVTDFGMARQASSNGGSTMSVQSSTMAFGTPAYMSPEQISGKNVGATADVYSLGVLLFEMLTGELPFSDDSPLALAVRKTETAAPSAKRVAPALRDTWAKAIQKCLAAKPEDRFQDVRELLEFLESRSRSMVYRRLALRKAKRVVQTRVFLALAAALILLGIFALWTHRHRDRSSEEQRVWQNASYSLQSNEPLAAMQMLLRASERFTPNYRAFAETALAFHLLEIHNRSESLLGGLSKWMAPAADRQYGDAVAALIRKDPEQALAILKQRSDAQPNEAMLLADLAHFETLIRKKPSPLWTRVAQVRPDHPAAHLAAAQNAMLAGDWTGAEREYLAADTLFRAQSNDNMVRAVSARRGLSSLAAGYPEAAKAELLPFSALGIGPPHSGSGPCERYVTLQAGANDGFQAPEDGGGTLSPRMSAYLLGRAMIPRKFDEGTSKVDQQLATSFALPPVRFCSGQLSYRMRRSRTIAGADNDAILVGAAPFEAVGVSHIQVFPWAIYPSDSEVEAAIELTAETLANVQRAYAGQPLAFLDVFAGDDTDFDYFKLVLVY
jgi:serine/threonine protein kinase